MDDYLFAKRVLVLNFRNHMLRSKKDVQQQQNENITQKLVSYKYRF